MKYQYTGFLLIILLASCAPLTKTQVKAVNSFAEVSKDFSAYPSKIMTGLADIRMTRGVYFANSLDNPRFHLQELDSVYSFRQQNYALTEKVDISFKIIDKYAQSLLLLSSDKFAGNLKEQANRFGLGLDSLATIYNTKNFEPKVPVSIGSAVGQVIAFGGSQFVKRKQAREIKKFVPKADQLVAIMTNNLIEFLESKNIATLIDNESKGITDNYLSFLRQSRTVSSAFTGKDTMILASNTKSTIANDLQYIALKSSLDDVKILREETLEATRDLRKAHAKLLETISERRKLRTAISEIQELYEGVRNIRKTIQRIEKYKIPVAEPEN